MVEWRERWHFDGSVETPIGRIWSLIGGGPAWLLALLFGLLVLLTLLKILRMLRIRGCLAGATPQLVTIRQLWHSPPPRSAFWVSWTDEDIRRPGGHRLNVREATWERLDVGDPLELIRLPGDPEAYLRDGIYASTGNLVFDLGLLIAELVGLGAMIWRGLGG